MLTFRLLGGSADSAEACGTMQIRLPIRIPHEPEFVEIIGVVAHQRVVSLSGRARAALLCGRLPGI